MLEELIYMWTGIDKKTPQEHFNILDEKIFKHNKRQKDILTELENLLNLKLD